MKNIQYINAGAGSGKTTKLTQILSEQLSNTDNRIKPSEVILTTFTELAASEFREKSRHQLFKDGHPDIAAELDSATIGTVHAVALNFIQRYWYLIGVSPDMKVMSEDDLQVYISESLGHYVTSEHIQFFNSYRAYFDIKDAQSKADYDFWKEHLLTIIEKANNYAVDIERSKTDSCAVVERIFSSKTLLNNELLNAFVVLFLSESESYSDSVKKSIRTLLDGLKAKKCTYAIISSLYKELTSEDKYIGKTNRNNLKQSFSQYDALVDNLKDVQMSSGGDNTPGGMMKQMITILFDIAKEWKDDFNAFKAQRHIIDYNDMERLFLKLLSIPQVVNEIKGTYKLMMVDEFQDSSPVQLEIFKLLSDLMQKSYWVGDPKQSIYGFRGADVELVNELTQQFLDKKGDPQLNLTHDNLPNSWRTREPLVKLTNDCFTRAFEGVISKENVELDAARKEVPEFSSSLYHWNCYVPSKGAQYSFHDKVADRIALLMTNRPTVLDKDTKKVRPLQYGDMAILCRRHSECKNFAEALIKKGIPVSYVNNDILQQIEVQLVFTLLKFMVNSSNKHVRADLLHLLEDKPTQVILQSRLDYIMSLKANDEDTAKDLWLDDGNPLIQKLRAFEQTVRNLSVSDLLESIIYGLCLPQVVAKWGDADNRRQNLQSLCSLAKKYDEHCLQMGIGASVGGLLTYLSYAEIDTKIDNAANAVKVLTYHGSKGLEWYYVILSSLEDDSLEEKEFMRKDFWGVRELRHPEPNEQYAYVVQFLPRINSTPKTNLPQPIIDKCKELSTFKPLLDKERNELRHLLYVGVTRARDYLTTLSKQTSKDKLPILSWIKNTGISDGVLSGNAANLWQYEALKPVYEDITNCQEATVSEATEYKHYQYPDNPILSQEPKYLSPSKLPEIVFAQENIQILTDLDCRIDPFKPDGVNEAAAGTCIHNIFAVYDPALSHEENVQKAARIRNGNMMYEVIPDIEKVVISIEQLYAWLENTYGTPYAIKHEVPFTQPLPGQIVRGEIDLLWYLNAQECILVDFKNYPGKKAIITTPGESNRHYAGKYASQLKAYHDVLVSAGVTVRDTLIYYSVMGCVVKLKMN